MACRACKRQSVSRLGDERSLLDPLGPGGPRPKPPLPSPGYRQSILTFWHHSSFGWHFHHPHVLNSITRTAVILQDFCLVRSNVTIKSALRTIVPISKTFVHFCSPDNTRRDRWSWLKVKDSVHVKDVEVF